MSKIFQQYCEPQKKWPEQTETNIFLCFWLHVFFFPRYFFSLWGKWIGFLEIPQFASG